VREIQKSTLNGTKQKLWDEILIESKGLLPVIEDIESAVTSAKHLGAVGFEMILLNY
jgi:hypothetical protein